MTRFALAAAAAAVTLRAGGAVVLDPLAPVAPDFFPKQKRGKGQNNRRGKGKSNPPRSRSNRLHVSKRVRRKHRRQA